MPTFWKSQFDKILMAGLVVSLCGLAVMAGDEKVSAFALQSAAGCLGCLITLVTGRRPVAPDPFLEPTSGSSSQTIKTETTTVAEIPKPKDAEPKP